MSASSIGDTNKEHASVAVDLELEKAWDDMTEAWHSFTSEGVDPHLSSAVRPEIADSWTRCKAAGLDFSSKNLSKSVSDEEFCEVLEIYEPLIEAVTPFLGIIERCGLSGDYVFELVARNGISLLRTGNLDLHEFIGSRDIFNETAMGTNAHSLCMSRKSPFSVVGHEHYCVALHGLAAEASPIIDENGVVIAALVLTQPLPPDPWVPAYQKMLAHALGMVTSIASAVEYHVRLQHLSDDLAGSVESDARFAARFSRMQSILSSAVDVNSDPIMIASVDGIIQNISPEAAHILSESPLDLVGRSVESVLGIPWKKKFGVVLKSGRSESAKVSVRGKFYKLRASGIRGLEGDSLAGVMLRLEEGTHSRIANSSADGGLAEVSFDDILGYSPQIARAITTGRRFAVTAENVLIVGESGTGKELFAQAIHNESRADGPFMAINCAAIPPRLIESELFGYESGAFTGAERGGKAGKIELANGGTLFLDEIGDMPLELQATILRVLENKRVTRLGGKTYKQVDFRVVAATNRDLYAMVQEGKFREDLLYRLAILTVELPPLREREGDPIFFAKHFLNECQRKAPGGPRDFSEAACKFIKANSWFGNVRQLKNAIFSAYYSSNRSMIDEPDFFSYSLRASRASDGRTLSRSGETDTPVSSKSDQLADFQNYVENYPHPISLNDAEAAIIKLSMRLSNGNVNEAALLLGLSKATLYRKLKEHGIR